MYVLYAGTNSGINMEDRPKISAFIDKAIFDYKMIEPGDKILIGASGGKDSTALIHYFSNRIKRPDCNFEFGILNIASEISGGLPEKISALFKKWGVKENVVEINVQERLKPGRKMSCYWCTTQRRTELLRYAMANGYNKIALGHHMDDILETLLMNMLNQAKITTMPPRLQYEKYPVEIIRPLCYVSEDYLKEEAEIEGYAGFTCTCDFLENGDRKHARMLLEHLTEGSRIKKEHLFESMRHIDKTYLP